MDRRVKYTKRVIKESFLSLLEDKDISNITVKELCEVADVNRGTFYRYYVDIYDLLKKIEDEFIDEIKNSSSMINMSEHTIYSFTKGILDIFEKNKRLVKILFNADSNIYFLDDVLEIAYEKCISSWENNNNSSDPNELENSVVFIFNGALGVINYWIKNDFNTSSSVLAKYIQKSCLSGVRKFIPNSKIVE
jgi:AcrR family transcriptional regulator